MRAEPAIGVSAALAVVAALGGALTFFVDGILTGAPVGQGSARGTALVILVVAVPALVGGMVATVTVSPKAYLVWLGAEAYLAYNAFLLLYGTPYNRLFLLYAGHLGLSLWALALTGRRLDADEVAARFASAPARGIAVYTWVVVALNALAWLRTVIPSITADRPDAFLDGSGMTTNPVFVNDLALWLPLAAVAAAWLWQRRPWGYLVTGSILVMLVIESISIATDQWFGGNADPGSPHASTAMVVPFAILALIGLVPVVLLLRGRRGEPAG